MSYGGYGGHQGGYGGYGGGYGQPQQAGGYGGPAGFAPAPRQPPPGADPELWALFGQVDRDLSGCVNAVELQTVLLNDSTNTRSQFDLETIKLLMSIFDTDRSGTINFNEFSGLFKYIKDWLSVFWYFDRDRSGTIDGAELRQALERFGYTNFSPQLLQLIEKKYSAVTDPRRSPPGISFDRFICACVHIKQLTEAFKRIDTNQDGVIEVNYDTFMHTVLSST